MLKKIKKRYINLRDKIYLWILFNNRLFTLLFKIFMYFIMFLIRLYINLQEGTLDELILLSWILENDLNNNENIEINKKSKKKIFMIIIFFLGMILGIGIFLIFLKFYFKNINNDELSNLKGIVSNHTNEIKRNTKFISKFMEIDELKERFLVLENLVLDYIIKQKEINNNQSVVIDEINNFFKVFFEKIENN